MQTRTENLRGFLLILPLALMGCKGAVVNNGKTCSLNYDEDYKIYLELLAKGEAKEEDAPRACNIPEQEPGANLSINLVMRDFNDEQEKKELDAAERLKIVINSTEFKERILAHTYNGELTFVDNGGFSNEEIYQKIMEGAETLTPEIDYEMDIDVTMYYKSSSTVGYTYPDTNRTWVNSKFFNGYTPGQVAANMAHEWTHKIGFDHSFYNNAARPYSVPYAVGSIISELVDSM
jgi:hypothetical protein